MRCKGPGRAKALLDQVVTARRPKQAMNFCPLINSRSRRRAPLDRFVSNRPATQPCEVADIVASCRTLDGL
jgi:hypothetical protein